MQSVKLQFEQNHDYRTREAFKTLRSNIEFCGGDTKMIAVTSCTPNEGKSSVAMELARAFAEAGNKTILIDADMRKSVLVGRYKTGAVKLGLTHKLVGRVDYGDVMCTTNVPNLYMIFSGPVPPNPSELLGGSKFKELLEQMRKIFDYVIVDTPPLGSVIDAAVASQSCDGTVLVVESNAVSYRFVQRVKEQLDKAGCRILGVVLNKVDMSSKGYYGHYGNYYGKYYGKYYGRYGEEAASYVAEEPEPSERDEKTKKAEGSESDEIEYLEDI
ncbi:MAG: polysaccharide biosynthesis tyrosine autokinase [Lachnospiraceae bacterium]|nr:polysaccharide biosynthesis tyrosine autokinase [Lachnospiraceae bacterium]